MKKRHETATTKQYIRAGALRRALLLTTAFVLAFVMTGALSGCGQKGKEPAGADVSKSVAGIEYYHYDTADFYKGCDQLGQLAADGKTDEAIRKYDALYKDMEEMDTLYAVIYVMYSTDVTNDYYTKEQLYASEEFQKSGDRLCEVCKGITEGPCADAFREHVGKEAFEAFAEYDVMTARQKEILKEETKLVDDYYELLDASEKMTYSYNDEDWTFDMINGEEGEELSVSDYEGYVDIYDGLLEKINAKAGPIYLKLVDLRTEFAKESGYEDYAAYADAEEYNRDYTEAEVKQLHKDVKKIAKTYFDNYYAAYDSASAMPEMSEQKLLDTLLKYSEQVDDMAGASAQQMTGDKLITLGEGEGRQDGAFTTYIRKAGCPFISMSLSGDQDFITLSHEFGHFVEYNNETQKNILTDEDNIDLAEVASNGLQGLMTCFYDDIFKAQAKQAKIITVGSLLENVIDGCIEDEFQRAVYKDPDMDLEELNKLYANIYAQYNTWAADDPGYAWVFVSHNFESPMYYISYTVSALAALQIWNQSNKNFGKAVRTWEKFIDHGTYNRTYLDVVGKCGLIQFTEKGAVKKICKPALDATSNELELDFNYDLEN